MTASTVADRPSAPPTPPADRPAGRVGRSPLSRRVQAAGGGPAVLGLVVVAALPGWEMHRVFSGNRALPLAVGAAVGGTVCSLVVTAGIRRRLRVSALVALLGLFVYAAEAVAAPTTTLGLPGSATVRAVSDGAVHGVADLLSTSLPADPDPALLLPLAIGCWVAGWVGVELALRRRWVATPLLPALLVTAGATALSVGREVGAGSAGAAFAVAAGLVLAARWRAHGAAPASVAGSGVGLGAADDSPPLLRSGRAPTGSGWTVAVPVAAVVIVIGVVLGPPLTFGRDRHPLNPRSARSVPASTLSALSPLDDIPALLAHSSQHLFTVRAARPTDWELTSFDRFDGFDWSSSGAYQSAGQEVPPAADTPAVTGSSLVQHVHIQGLSGPWLPAAPTAHTVTGVGFRADAGDASLLARTGQASGATYTVHSTLASPSTEVLEDAPVATGPAVAGDTGLPAGLPALLAQTATVATAGGSTPFTRALLLERYLRTNYRVNAKAAGGHSYGRLVQFLGVQRTGTSEQFATAFAVLARHIGLPTRVVVGFQPGTETAPGVYQVTGADVLAWPEIDFAGVGWVAFAPTPTGAGGSAVPLGGSRQGQSFVIMASPQVPVTAPPIPPPSHPASVPPAPVDRVSSGRSIVLPLLLAAAAVALLGALVPVVLRRRRRHRSRHDPSARRRIVGAWDATRSRLDQVAGPLPPGATVAELIDVANRHDAAAGRALTGLYRPVNQALFDLTEPGEADAERAWRAYDAFAGLAGRGSLPDRVGLTRFHRRRERVPVHRDDQRKGTPVGTP